jgi:hypothetical protein
MSPKKAKVKNQKVTLPDGDVIDMHERHDFDKPTKLLLQHMAAGVCSNPDCLNHTIGSNLERNNYAGNGIAAHICAAAPGPGAARYNKHQTKEERSSYKNGIWLCGSCSIIIDRDEPQYPVVLLNEWKFRAERRSMSMVGTKSLTHFELAEGIRAEVFRALTLSFEKMANPFLFPIHTYHQTYTASLEDLDPRYDVKVNISDSGIFHVISPKPGQNPKVTLVLRNEEKRDVLSQRWSDLLKKGHPFEVSLDDVAFEGSPLFEAIATERGLDGRLVIKKNQPDIESIMYLTDANGAEIEIGTSFAKVVSGSEELTILGSFLDGMFSFVYRNMKESHALKFDVSLSFELWRGRDIRNLPHLHKALKAAQFIRQHKGVQIGIDFIFGSRSVRIGEEHTVEYEGFLGFFCWLVKMVDKGKAIAEKVKQPLIMHSLVVDEYDELSINNLYPVLNGPLEQSVKAGEQIWDASYESYQSTVFDQLSGVSTDAEIQINEERANSFNLFGNVIMPPCYGTKITGFIPVVNRSEPADAGNVNLKIFSTDGTKMVSSLSGDGWEVLGQTPEVKEAENKDLKI